MDKPVNITAYEKKKDKAFEKKQKARLREQCYAVRDKNRTPAEQKKDLKKLYKTIEKVFNDNSRFKPVPKGFLGP